MIWLITLLLFIVGAFLENSYSLLPLCLLLLLSLSGRSKEQKLYFLAIVGGILLDLLNARMLGATPLFFCLMLGVTFLYQRKYEIDSYIFITVTSGLMSVLYAFVFSLSKIYLVGLSSMLVGVICLKMWRSIIQKEAR